MKIKINPVRLVMAGTFTVTVALLATIPFNMGGCAAGNLDVMQLAKGVGKVAKAGGMNARNERAIGESVSLALTNQYGVTQNEKLAQYVVLVGQTVASRTPRADQPWVFGVLDTDAVNAFSGPGGYVWVTRGAIEQMQDESELAGVLGHEIGHVVQHHGLDAAKQAGVAEGVLTAASASENAAQFGNLSDKMVDIVLKQGFTEPQEFVADQESVKYTTAAGYDPAGFLHFLQRIRQKQKSGGANLFSTHPGLDDRISRVSSQISAAGTGGRGTTLKGRFNEFTGKAPQSAAANFQPLP